MSDQVTTFEYAGQQFDISAMPLPTVVSLVRRTVAHILGNEVASAIAAKAEAAAATGTPLTDDQKAALKAQLIAEKANSIRTGQVSVTVRGPRGTALETIMRALAEGEIKETLKANGLTMPSGDKTVKFPDGQEFTRAVLIARRLERHGDRLRKEAEAEVKRRERAAGRAAKDAPEGATGAEALGL